MRRFRPQHPEPADVQGRPGGHVGPGQRDHGRGQGDQRRGRVDQTVGRVGRGPLRRVVLDRLVVGRRHVARRLPEAGQ